MNAPSSPVRDEMAPLDPAGTQGPSPRQRARLATVGAWFWLLGNQQKTLARGPAAKPSPYVLTLTRWRRMRQSARALPIWIVIWYAVFLVPPFLLEHRWRKIGPDHEARKWPALRQLVSRHADRPLIVMLGSSRVCWAFRANRLNDMRDSDGRPLSAFNFGVPATGPISNLFYLRDMLAEGIRPRFLLIEFLPPLMGEPRRGSLNEEALIGYESLSTHRFLQWLPYLNRPEKRAHLWLEGRINPWYAFRRRIQREVICLTDGKPFPKHETMDALGWHLPSPLPIVNELRKYKVEADRIGYSSGLNRFRPGKKPLKALRETLDLCRREKIPAALVLMPESSEFRSWYSEEAKAMIHGILDELHQTYGVAILDANTWVADQDFEDGHHTQLFGAEVFTSHLQAELAPLLAQSAAMKSD